MGEHPNWGLLHHEKYTKDGFAQITAGPIIPSTALDPTNPVVSTTYDITNTSTYYQLGTNHFINFFNGKPAEHNLKILYFED